MQNINFYDRSLRIRRDWVDTESAAVALGVVVLAVAAAGLWLQQQTRSLQAPAAAAAAALETQRTAMTALARQIAALRPDAAVERRLLQLQATLQQRQGALQRLGQGGGLAEAGGYSAALAALAQQSIDGLWLTGVSMDNGDMALRGRSVRPELVAAYVGRLDSEAALRGHAFRALDIRRQFEAAAAPDPAASAGGEAAAAAPRLAAYVEFSLVGARGTGADAVAAEARR